MHLVAVAVLDLGWPQLDVGWDPVWVGLANPDFPRGCGVTCCVHAGRHGCAAFYAHPARAVVLPKHTPVAAVVSCGHVGQDSDQEVNTARGTVTVSPTSWSVN
jgi:hypothetical protein